MSKVEMDQDKSIDIAIQLVELGQSNQAKELIKDLIRQAFEFSPPKVLSLEEQAWELYCAETAGDMDVRDSWEQLSDYIRNIFLAQVMG